VSTPKPDYKAIATEAVDLLCRIGYLGLDRSRQRELWQMALDLDRKLHPYRERTIVWTEEEGDVEPPRKVSGKPLPVANVASDGTVTFGFAQTLATSLPGEPLNPSEPVPFEENRGEEEEPKL
jgi:hypothetical protein